MLILEDDSRMPFGKYKGTQMANVPASYLLWLWEKQGSTKPFGEASQAVQRYILDNLEALRMEVKPKDN